MFISQTVGQTDRQHTDAQTFPPYASQRSFQTTAHVEGPSSVDGAARRGCSGARGGAEQLVDIVDN